jgi:hypothetical protein
MQNFTLADVLLLGTLWGFGDIKPWTATEQKAAVQKENKILEEANKSIK